MAGLSAAVSTLVVTLAAASQHVYDLIEKSRPRNEGGARASRDIIDVTAADGMETLEPARGTTSADRVADVLLAFSAAESSLGVSQIARQLGMSKAVVHRILQSLVARGLLQHNERTHAYGLGPAAVMLGARTLAQMDLRDVARPELMWLRNETQETTTLSLLVNDRRAYIDQFPSPKEIKMTVELGRGYPLHAGASSRVILAHMTPADRERVLTGPLMSLTSETITEEKRLAASLRLVAEKGYATSHGERQSGAGSVAAPVFATGGRVVGAISICGPQYRFDEETVARFIPMAVEAARRISRHFSGSTR